MVPFGNGISAFVPEVVIGFGSTYRNGKRFSKTDQMAMS